MKEQHLRIKAQMARHQLLTHQLAPYPHPDRNGEREDPRRDPETLRDVWRFLAWLELYVSGKEA